MRATMSELRKDLAVKPTQVTQDEVDRRLLLSYTLRLDAEYLVEEG